MVRGLLSEVPRKNLWQLAEAAGHRNPGAKSAGVQRQYTGTAVRIENAQVRVHLSYGSGRGRTVIDAELYLGRNWASTTAEHERCCAEQGIPPERASAVATKPELARRMLERALAASVPFTYFLAYGQCRALRAWLEEHYVRYVLAIPKDEVLPLPDGRTRQARELWALVPEETFERRSCADGAKGPHAYDWAAVQLTPTSVGLERHLLIRRSTVPNKKWLAVVCWRRVCVGVGRAVTASTTAWEARDDEAAALSARAWSTGSVRRPLRWPLRDAGDLVTRPDEDPDAITPRSVTVVR